MLIAISNRFLDHKSEKIVVLLGMGGSGKTQLALEFCRHAEEDLGFSAVFWINASSQNSVFQSYRAIAKAILKGHQVDADSEDVISLVQDTLREWESLWLMVFDNYENPKAFETTSIEHYIPRGKQGRVIFTSRHQDSARLGHKIDVSGMNQAESLEVLFQRPPLNDEESRYGGEIAATLGNLPLALDQASSYLRARKVRLCDYVASYHKCKEHILKETPDVWEYRSIINDKERETRLNIFTTWQLSFNLVSGDEQEIRQKEHLLTLAAFFNITAISDRYFEAYFNAKKPEWMAMLSSEGRWDVHKLEGVLAEFHNLSLIQMKEHAMDQQLFSIHPVVRDWVQLRKSRKTRQRFAQEFIETLSSYLADIDIDLLDLETKQETLLHIDGCIEYDKELLSGSSYSSLDDNYTNAASRFAKLYAHQRRDGEMTKLLERAMSGNLKKLGTKHIATLWARVDLATAYRYQGRLDEAEQICDQLLNDAEESLGATHHLTLGSTTELAAVYSSQRRHNEAEELYNKVLIDSEKTHGATHDITLVILNNLADTHLGQGRYDKAENLYNQALTGQIEKLGPTHPDTLRTLHNLGLVYYNQHRFTEAEKLHQQVLNGRMES